VPAVVGTIAALQNFYRGRALGSATKDQQRIAGMGKVFFSL
jgi:hypothetical protein